MATKIYSSGNYVIVDDGTKIYEYAKGHTIYTFVDNVFYIKEITQGQFMIKKEDIGKSYIVNQESIPYTFDSFITFLRENTGFKTAAGGSAATVQNSNLSYTTTVNSGDTLNLPDITVTDSDGSTFTAPSVQDITCTLAVAPVGATLMKTGQTTSYRTGDDGDLEAGRATSFTVLASNNPFGNTNRFTDELGGQTYTNKIYIDWSTYNGSNVLGYNLDPLKVAAINTWNQAINNSASTSIGIYTSGWRLWSIKEYENIRNYGVASYRLNYSPINLQSFNTAFIIWTSTTFINNTAQAYAGAMNADLAPINKTNSTPCGYVPVRTFTVTGTTLT